MSKIFSLKPEQREKVNQELIQDKWKKDFAPILKKESTAPVKAIQFLTNYVVVAVDNEYEDSIKTGKLNLDLFVPKQASGNNDAARRDNNKDDPEREFNPLKRKRNYGTAITVPKELTTDIKIYQVKESEPVSNVYRSGEDCHALGIPYICGGYTPEWVTCADIVPEVQPGDKVYFHYLTVDGSNEVKGEYGRSYYKLRYNNIFCVVREGKIIPIGGWVLLEPKYDEGVEVLPAISEKGNRLPELTAKRTKTGIIYEANVKPKAIEGIVRHVGTPLKVDTCELQPGDVVSYELNANMVVPIEGKDYYVIPYRDILGKV